MGLFKKIDLYAVQFQTTQMIIYVRGIIELAKNLAEDTDRVTRLKESLCPACYYSKDGVIVGQSFIRWNCGICQKEGCDGHPMHSLCEACAMAHGLCKRCGADLDLKVRRKL